MGFLRRIIERISEGQAGRRGAVLEAQGKLEEAYEAYLGANLPLDAARILVARADAELDPTRRVALLRIAARRAPAGSAPALEAKRRAALLRLDLARQSSGAALPSEWIDLAHELEGMHLLREAGEAFAMGGDVDNQTRVLVACGAIDDLELALESARRERSDLRDRDQAWKRMHDLDAVGKRLDALRAADAWLTTCPDDEPVASFSRTVRERLVPAGPIPLTMDGRPLLVVVDCPVVIGRSEASIVLPSPALSRKHLELSPSAEGVAVRDLGSRNGTFLAGARLDGPIVVRADVELRLGGQIPCRVAPRAGGGVTIALPGQEYVAPLGPLRLGPFDIVVGADAAQLVCPAGTPAPVLNGLRADGVVELCFGDEVRQERDGPVLFQVTKP